MAKAAVEWSRDSPGRGANRKGLKSTVADGCWDLGLAKLISRHPDYRRHHVP